MKRKGLVGFLMGCFICILMALPSFVYADVTINSHETSMVDLEDVNPTTGRNAYVTDDGMVSTTSGNAALWASVNGWSINVSDDGIVRTMTPYSVIFNSASDGSGTYLNGTLTNLGKINAVPNSNGIGVALGSGMITNSGTIQGNEFGALFSGVGTGTAAVTNNAGGLIRAFDIGLYIEQVGTATVINSGTIHSSNEEGIYISDVVGTATVINSGTIQAYGSGIYIEDVVGTATVTNNFGGLIQSDDYDGIYMNNVGTAIVTNYGTIQGYDAGVYIENTTTATVTNNAGGTINSWGGFGYYSDGGSGGGGWGVPGIPGSGGSGGWNYNDDMIYYTYGGNGDNGDDAYGNDWNNVWAGDGGVGGDANGGDGHGIYIGAVDTAMVTNNFGGTINGYGGDAYGGDGGNGGSASHGYAYAQGGNGGVGGNAYGGDGYGIYIENVGTASVTNSSTINGYGGDGVGGYGGDGGNGSSTYSTYGGNGGSGGYGYGGNGYGIFIGNVLAAANVTRIADDDIVSSMTATVTNSGTINGSGGDAWGGSGGSGGSGGPGGPGGGGYDGVGGYGYGGTGVGIGIQGIMPDKLVDTGMITAYDGVYTVTGTANVINNAGGTINAYGGNGYGVDGGYGYGGTAVGIGIYGVDTATVTNAGTINAYGGTGSGGIGGNGYGGDGYGIGIENVTTATVTNSGTINAYGGSGGYSGYSNGAGYGIGIQEVTTATVTNNTGGVILSAGGGIDIENVGTATVTNSGNIQGVDDGVYIGYADTAKVTNNAGGVIQSSDGNGVSLQSIEIPDTAEVINSGTIQGADDGIYIGYAATAKVTNNAGGFIQAGSDDGIDIEHVGTATVTNSGTIQGDDDGIHVDYVVGTATVTNSGTITSTNDEGIDVEEAETATVTNSGNIQAYYSGIEINGPATVTSTANVTNSGMITSNNGDGIYIEDVGTATVTNSGIISGGTGIYMYDVDKATVENAGTITGTNGWGVFMRAEDDGASVSVNNSGTISSTSGESMRIILHNTNETASVINTATGVISGNSGIYMDVANSNSTGEIKNSGIITSHGDGMDLTGYGQKTITNYAGGVIYGDVYGIRGINGPTTIYNYGTITGADGTAIKVNRDNNEVTLGTGSVINGDIRANNSYSNNYMILDGEGTIRADQMQQFGYLNKTGAGTWTLTGDMDYDGSYNNNGHSITVEEGILALAERGSHGFSVANVNTISFTDGFSEGVVTDSFTQLAGASLGFAVTATGSTGALTVYGNANFNNGTIVVIPAVGTYAATTPYEHVLDVHGSINNPWTKVTANSAFLSPSLVEQEYSLDGTSQVYDLVLKRLSFSTGATGSNASLGAALDGMYDGAEGDMRNILDELLLVSPGDAQRTLSEMGGGTHTAFQFLSFYGLNKYHGALNNHLSGGSGFAGGLGKGMAYNQNGYPQGIQAAVAAGGNTLSDAAPILLAMAGNGGQLASGTNWDLWLDGYYSRGDRRSDDIIAKYKQTLYGALMGLDYRVTDNLLIGASVGLSQAEVKFDDLLDKGNQDSYQGSLYASYDGKPWYAAGILTYAHNAYKMDRFITVGPITQVAHSDYSGNEYAGYAEVGYKLDLGGVLEIRPLAAFQAAYLMQDAYMETGAGGLNLVVDSRNTGSYQSYLGLHISKAIAMGNFILTPDARLKWAHEFSADDHLINAKFSGAGSGSFTVVADRPSRDTAIVGLGLNLRFNKNLSAYIQYDAELNSDYTNHTGMLGLRFSW